MAEEHPIVIAGAGVAGLAAAYRLQRHGDVPFVVYERHPCVGGHSRTVRYGEFRFDLGGHRFYTRKAHIDALVREVVGDDLLVVNRLSRILFRGKLVDYPLRIGNSLGALGLAGAVHGAVDYGLMRCRRLVTGDGPEETFEQWALNRFGDYFYQVYFKVYTEKTWGVPCDRLSADFAEQRIKKISLREAVRDALLKKSDEESLVRQFVYPRYGFGQVPDNMAAAVQEPNRILTERPVVEVEHDGEAVRAVTTHGPDGRPERQPCRALISSIPLNDLAHMLRPAPPDKVLQAASHLGSRDMVILFLVLDVEQVSRDHWVYVPSPETGFCRFHEPKNWSRDMAPAGRTGLVIEYFCQHGDERWRQPADQLAREAAEDLERIGFIKREWVSDHTVVRLARAYPVYHLGYREHLDVVQGYLGRLANLHNVGRNATFLYTSSDHYMDMGLKAAENALGHDHDLGAIGRERGYAETGRRAAP